MEAFQGGITQLSVEVVVNTVNRQLSGGDGVDGAIPGLQVVNGYVRFVAVRRLLHRQCESNGGIWPNGKIYFSCGRPSLARRLSQRGKTTCQLLS